MRTVIADILGTNRFLQELNTCQTTLVQPPCFFQSFSHFVLMPPIPRCFMQPPQLRNHRTYEGILSTMMCEGSKPCVMLKYAKLLHDPSTASNPQAASKALAEKPQMLLTVQLADLVQLVAKDMRLNPSDLAATEQTDFFETDAAISRGRGG